MWVVQAVFASGQIILRLFDEGSDARSLRHDLEKRGGVMVYLWRLY